MHSPNIAPHIRSTRLPRSPDHILVSRLEKSVAQKHAVPSPQPKGRRTQQDASPWETKATKKPLCPFAGLEVDPLSGNSQYLAENVAVLGALKLELEIFRRSPIGAFRVLSQV